MNIKKTLITLLAFIAFSASAQIPNIIPYQGQIADTSGKAYDGKFDFIFSFKSSSGTSYWSSGTLNVPVYNGAYSVQLGESPQPSIPNDIWQNNTIYLEISFDDGVNGMEKLSPNVQLLPVPYAMRAAVADSAKNVNGQLAWGDSLVLRDAKGVVRFVMNPNTGEFKVMNNDTIWYEIESNSPPSVTRNNRGNESKTEYVIINGKHYTKTTTTTDGFKTEFLINQKRDGGARDTMTIKNTYDNNGCLLKKEVKYYHKGTKAIRMHISTYDCPSGSKKADKNFGLGYVGLLGNEKDNKETKTKTKETTEDGKLQMVTVDTRTGNKVKVTSDAKDSCFVVDAKKIVLKNDSIEYTIRINKNGSVTTTVKDLKSGLSSTSTKFANDDLFEEMRKLHRLTNPGGTFEQLIGPPVILPPGPFELPISEVYKPKEKSKTTKNIETVIRLIDSVHTTKYKSAKFVDSLMTTYDLVRGVIKLTGVQKEILENARIRNMVNYERGKTIATYVDKTTKDSVIKTIEPKLGLKIEQIILEEGDTLKRSIIGVDAGDLISYESTITHILKDSTVITTGINKRIDIIEGTTENVIIQIPIPKGLEFKVIESTTPKDSLVSYTNVKTLEFKDVPEILFVHSNGTKQAGFTIDANEEVEKHAGISQFILDFDSIVTVFDRDSVNSIISSIDPATGAHVGFFMDPNKDEIVMEGNNKTIFIADTLGAFDFIGTDGGASFNDDVYINGNLNVTGNVSKLGGSFKIDHPQDPYNKYLVHSFVESPDMMNVYNGNVVTDSNGEAHVSLPNYFESLNMEYRYQLTCIGVFAQAIVYKEIKGNTFILKTSVPNVKVSWQVTGIRKDPYARENRLKVEQEKEEEQKGQLLYEPKKSN